MDEFLQPAQRAARQAEIDYLAALKSGPELDAELKKRVDSLFTEQMKTLAAQRGAETAAYNTAPSEARAQYADIENPLERERLAQQYTAAKLRPLIGTTTMLNAVGGTSGDILNSLMASAQGDREYKKARMDSTSKHYESVLDNFYRLAQLQQSAANSAANRGTLVNIPGIGPVELSGSELIGYMDKLGAFGSNLTATQQKQLTSAKDALSLIGEMKSGFEAGGGGNILNSITASLPFTIGGRINPSGANYKERRTAIAGALKDMFGQSGVLTDKDIELLASNLPTLGMGSKQAMEKFDNLMTRIKNRAKAAGFTDADLYGDIESEL